MTASFKNHVSISAQNYEYIPEISRFRPMTESTGLKVSQNRTLRKRNKSTTDITSWHGLIFQCMLYLSSL